MPKSRSRKTASSQPWRYQAPPKKKPKPSPPWYGPAIIALMLLGVLVIVLNYIGRMPGTGGVASNAYLFGGLGLIAVGFLAATQWR